MDLVQITDEPISVESVARRIVPPECGATVTLDGYARKFTRRGDSLSETEYLVYEAYDDMAVNEMKKLVSAAKEKFAVSAVGIAHRKGRVDIGETAVVISVAAPHRKDAFAACEWLITELKRTVPIWKKEVYAGGSEWSEGEFA